MQSGEYHEEITYACGDGKQLWTRDVTQVKWCATREETLAVMAQAQEKCRDQAWVGKSTWVVHGEYEAKAKLETLRLAASH